MCRARSTRGPCATRRRSGARCWTGRSCPAPAPADPALVGEDVETARFFPEVRLNYAEALLRPLPGVADDAVALTATHAGRPAERWTRAELPGGGGAHRHRARRDRAPDRGSGSCSSRPMRGTPLVAALAVAALGAALSTATPDMGTAALLGRFEQVEPTLLLVDRTGMATGGAEALVGCPARGPAPAGPRHAAAARGGGPGGAARRPRRRGRHAAPGGVAATPVRHPAVRDVLLGHHRRRPRHRARRRRHAARARQGAPAARRPAARRHAVLPHLHAPG